MLLSLCPFLLHLSVLPSTLRLLLLMTAMMLLHSCCWHCLLFLLPVFFWLFEASKETKCAEAEKESKRENMKSEEDRKGKTAKQKTVSLKQDLWKTSKTWLPVRTSQHVRTASLSAIILTCHRPPTEPQREATRLCGTLWKTLWPWCVEVACLNRTTPLRSNAEHYLLQKTCAVILC